MNKKFLFIGAGVILTGAIAFVFIRNKAKINAQLDTSITNGDKTSASSLSDAQNKTSVQTTPVKIEEAKALSALIAKDLVNLNNYKKASSKANVQAEINKNTQKLFEMGYIALPDGGIQKI